MYPDWLYEAVFYQIFPDRFKKGTGQVTVPDYIQQAPWGSSPSNALFQGGNLWGILEKIPYLKELGITALYLNPINPSNVPHRYHGADDFHVSPFLGGDSALEALVRELHENDMRIILDWVPNHSGTDHPLFQQALREGPNGEYADWYKFHDLGTDDVTWDGWFGLMKLPVRNLLNTKVQEHLIKGLEYWIKEFDIDGIRVDVPECIQIPSFWNDVRSRTKTLKPDFYMVGEFWECQPMWIPWPFDGTMNYPFTRAAYAFFGGKSLNPNYRMHEFNIVPYEHAVHMAQQINTLNTVYGDNAHHAHLNLTASHDTHRTSWAVSDNSQVLEQIIVFQMTMPGAPMIYYGDEIGMTYPLNADGVGDPHCRAAFNWDESTWNHCVRNTYTALIRIRQTHPALQRGTYHTVYPSLYQGLSQGHPDIFAYSRIYDKKQILVVHNRGEEEVRLTIDQSIDDQLWPTNQQTTSENKLHLPPRTSAIYTLSTPHSPTLNTVESIM